MLFVRDFHAFSGGHLKYFDYLCHAAASGIVEPVLYLTPRSRAADNPFGAAPVSTVPQIDTAASYFIAGMDWLLLDKAGVHLDRPIINLIQHVRHADPEDPRYPFLSRPALRICVSPEIHAALQATGRINGDMVTIENGIDIERLGARTSLDRTVDVFLGGLKNPRLAGEIAAVLSVSGLVIDVAAASIGREVYLDRMARARLCLLLPSVTEGFYLPALEAMALGTPVIVPDCVGNRGFCRPNETCVMPRYCRDALVQATLELASDVERRRALAQAGLQMAQHYSLSRERHQFIRLLAEYVPGWIAASAAGNSGFSLVGE
jgi:hypothetical protein